MRWSSLIIAVFVLAFAVLVFAVARLASAQSTDFSLYANPAVEVSTTAVTQPVLVGGPYRYAYPPVVVTPPGYTYRYGTYYRPFLGRRTVYYGPTVVYPGPTYPVYPNRCYRYPNTYYYNGPGVSVSVGP